MARSEELRTEFRATAKVEAVLRELADLPAGMRARVLNYAADAVRTAQADMAAEVLNGSKDAEPAG